MSRNPSHTRIWKVQSSRGLDAPTKELLREIYSHTSGGDRTPSQLLRIMRRSTHDSRTSVFCRWTDYQRLQHRCLHPRGQTGWRRWHAAHWKDVSRSAEEIKLSLRRSRKKCPVQDSGVCSHNQERQNNEDICWFHQIFRDKARKCKKPCKYQTAQENWNTGE